MCMFVYFVDSVYELAGIRMYALWSHFTSNACTYLYKLSIYSLALSFTHAQPYMYTHAERTHARTPIYVGKMVFSGIEGSFSPLALTLLVKVYVVYYRDRTELILSERSSTCSLLHILHSTFCAACLFKTTDYVLPTATASITFHSTPHLFDRSSLFTDE